MGHWMKQRVKYLSSGHFIAYPAETEATGTSHLEWVYGGTVLTQAYWINIHGINSLPATLHLELLDYFCLNFGLTEWSLVSLQMPVNNVQNMGRPIFCKCGVETWSRLHYWSTHCQLRTEVIFSLQLTHVLHFRTSFQSRPFLLLYRQIKINPGNFA